MTIYLAHRASPKFRPHPSIGSTHGMLLCARELRCWPLRSTSPDAVNPRMRKRTTLTCGPRSSLFRSRRGQGRDHDAWHGSVQEWEPKSLGVPPSRATVGIGMPAFCFVQTLIIRPLTLFLVRLFLNMRPRDSASLHHRSCAGSIRFLEHEDGPPRDQGRDTPPVATDTTLPPARASSTRNTPVHCALSFARKCAYICLRMVDFDPHKQIPPGGARGARYVSNDAMPCEFAPAQPIIP